MMQAHKTGMHAMEQSTNAALLSQAADNTGI